MIPGTLFPSAAPGLRAWGLKAGLAANGLQSTIILPKEMVERQLERWNGPQSTPPQLGDAVVVRSDRIMEHLVQHAPATVIATNWAGTAHLRPHPLLRIGLDFFSPTVLEHRYREANIDSVIRNKRAAIELADFFFVNGSRRVGYSHGWLAACGLDLRDIDVPAVNMSLPFDFRAENEGSAGNVIRINVTGYNQPWAPLAPVLEQLEALAVRAPIVVDVIAATDYWNQTMPGDALAETLQRLSINPKFQILPPVDYRRLGQSIRAADLVIDLFEHNIERAYSMSTRAIVALAHGVPVIHPGFTELGSLIKEYDAGWTDEAGTSGYAGLLEKSVKELQADPEMRARKKRAARALARAHFNPLTETRKLLQLLADT